MMNLIKQKAQNFLVRIKIEIISPQNPITTYDEQVKEFVHPENALDFFKKVIEVNKILVDI